MNLICPASRADALSRGVRWRRGLVALAAALAFLGVTPESFAEAYRSPVNVAFSPDGSLLAAADSTWGGVVIIDPQSRTVLREVALEGDPSYVVWKGNDKVLVSEGSNGTVAEVDATSGEFIRRLTAVRRAAGLARTSDGKVLLVCDRGLGKVAFVDLDKWQVAKTVDVVREPGYIALTGNDQYAVVSNKLPPSEDARTKEHGAQVSIIEVSTGNVRNVKLPGGSSIVRQVAISPDNRWAYVTHQIGRANSMVTQVDRGWTMTNGTSIIDIAKAELYASFLYDREGAGAANPWGLAVSPDGTKLWATLAGNSELAVVDLKGLHGLLADDVTRASLYNDIGTMSGKDLLTRRILSGVEGTRGIAVNQDGTLLAVASYFEGKVLLVDLAGDYLPGDETLSVRTQAVVLNNNPAEDRTRMGERLFNGAKYCNQHWLTCATCHEGGRMDSLNWDLMNDGQGNPKNTKSHVLSAVTPPTNITGCREDAHVSARAGYLNIEFTTAATPDVVDATYAYIESIAAEPSPYLGPDWKLTPDAVEGKKIFESKEADCSRCHPAPLFTDLTRWDVGTRLNPPDISNWDAGGYDTPTLVEVWRTAPYLHLGHAITLKDVLTTFNKEDKHGKTSHLSPQQLDQLVAYLMQIGPSADDVDADAGTTRRDSGNPNPADKGGGCMCRVGAIAGAPASASDYRMIVVGMTMLLLTVWRGRRASRTHAPKVNDAQGRSLKG